MTTQAKLRTLSGETAELADDQLAELRMTFRGSWRRKMTAMTRRALSRMG